MATGSCDREQVPPSQTKVQQVLYLQVARWRSPLIGESEPESCFDKQNTAIWQRFE
jgi:hypothetical protein